MSKIRRPEDIYTDMDAMARRIERLEAAIRELQALVVPPPAASTGDDSAPKTNG